MTHVLRLAAVAAASAFVLAGCAETHSADDGHNHESATTDSHDGHGHDAHDEHDGHDHDGTDHEGGEG